MGNGAIQRISFEDVQHAQVSGQLIINTLSVKEQGMLISKTVDCELEIQSVERAIRLKEPIIIYGKHCNDETIYVKYEQIKKLGGKVYVYVGGLFEWLLLQDIYGSEHFQTTGNATTVDLLKYKPINVLNTKYLTY
jgi:hypothetical protein